MSGLVRNQSDMPLIKDGMEPLKRPESPMSNGFQSSIHGGEEALDP